MGGANFVTILIAVEFGLCRDRCRSDYFRLTGVKIFNNFIVNAATLFSWIQGSTSSAANLALVLSGAHAAFFVPVVTTWANFFRRANFVAFSIAVEIGLLHLLDVLTLEECVHD